MPKFKFTAEMAGSGKKVSDTLEANDEQSAVKVLAAQGLSVTKIREEGSSTNLLSRFTSRVPSKDVVVFTRQLSTMVGASLPLLQALRLAGDQASNKTLQKAITEVAHEIEGGVPFSRALAKYPTIFDAVFIGVIAAGEASGSLDTALDRLAIQLERSGSIASKVRGAMIYPAIILVVLLGVVLFMVVKVLPQVQNVYSGIAGGASLPLITRFLLGISHVIIHLWWVIILVLIIVGYFARRWSQTEKGISTLDNFKLHAPLIGRLFTKMYMARFARTTSTLLANGLPLLQILQITSRAVDNVHIESSIDAASEKVRGGMALSQALTGDKDFLPLVPNMIKIGEQSGALDKMMEKTAEYFENEVDEEVNAISSTIEPVLMIVMGVFALLIVAAILLPIYGLVSKNINLGG